MANKGTIFLDEIGEMSPALQAKLLQVLQDSEFTRLGGNQEIKVDVRVVCATNRVLSEMVAEGGFREDLYFRLNVVNVMIPPLRERREEIPKFVENFMHRFAARYSKRTPSISDHLMQAFQRYSFPGNGIHPTRPDIRLHELSGNIAEFSNMRHRRFEAEYISPQTYTAAEQWLEYNYDKGQFFLYVDSFDPHEPWDPPAYYVELYDPDYGGEVISHPSFYGFTDDISTEILQKSRSLYAGEVTMVDRWMGRLLQKIEDLRLLENTMVVVMFLSCAKIAPETQFITDRRSKADKFDDGISSAGKYLRAGGNDLQGVTGAFELSDPRQ